jgi:hypothetical protein
MPNDLFLLLAGGAVPPFDHMNFLELRFDVPPHGRMVLGRSHTHAIEAV